MPMIRHRLNGTQILGIIAYNNSILFIAAAISLSIIPNMFSQFALLHHRSVQRHIRFNSIPSINPSQESHHGAL